MSKKTAISIFLDNNGKIERIPIPDRTKRPLLAYLADKFDTNRDYTEKEVNNIINSWHTFGDYFILRRLLIDYGFLGRTANGSRYWVEKKNQDDTTEAFSSLNKTND